jgi:sugar phosphate permease
MAHASALPALASAEDATYRKVAWRLLPFLFLCYVVAYLDRVNVGFAKLQMLGCPRRSNFDPPCRLNFDPGLVAGIA